MGGGEGGGLGNTLESPIVAWFGVQGHSLFMQNKDTKMYLIQ